MTRQSIKSYVIRRLGDGASLDVIWREALELFPHHCVSWGYMLTIKKVADARKKLLTPEKKP